MSASPYTVISTDSTLLPFVAGSKLMYIEAPAAIGPYVQVSFDTTSLMWTKLTSRLSSTMVYVRDHLMRSRVQADE